MYACLHEAWMYGVEGVWREGFSKRQYTEERKRVHLLTSIWYDTTWLYNYPQSIIRSGRNPLLTTSATYLPNLHDRYGKYHQAQHHQSSLHTTMKESPPRLKKPQYPSPQPQTPHPHNTNSDHRPRRPPCSAHRPRRPRSHLRRRRGWRRGGSWWSWGYCKCGTFSFEGYIWREMGRRGGGLVCIQGINYLFVCT